MKSYERCVNESSDVVKNERGNVYTNTGELVMKTYSYIDEITTEQLQAKSDV